MPLRSVPFMIILYEIAEGELSRQRQHSFCRSVPFCFHSVSFRSVYHFVTNSWRRPKQTKTAFILSNKHWWKLFFIVTSIHFAVPFRSVDDHFVRNSWRRPKQTKRQHSFCRSVPFRFHCFDYFKHFCLVKFCLALTLSIKLP